MTTKISNIAITVKTILQKHPKTREDDNLLALKVWAEVEPKLRHKDFTFIEFSSRFLLNEFPSYDSISRARRKLQEEFKELRGMNYRKRQKYTKEVIEDLRHHELKRGGTP